MPFPGFDLTGRTAIVLGGTSGIGRALVDGLVAAGADVAASSRRQAEVDSTALAIERRGKRSLRIAADVSDRASLVALREAAVEAFGKIDILVNCAGRTQRRPTLEVDDAEWQGILDVNLTGTLRACQVFGAHMLERGYGRIVNIASLASFVGLYEVAAYAASKGGVAALTRALAVEWGSRGVLVNAIAPGVFRTPLNQSLLDGTERGHEFRLRTPLAR
ncbi:MAG: SDR family NAD(P)-dependent oxidoreductase, partial [Thermoanaerobaculia bacterium]|nr:SDR family NAD(P)-dependent oxidoreductase [Thermoanaerobaculia bacterium]